MCEWPFISLKSHALFSETNTPCLEFHLRPAMRSLVTNTVSKRSTAHTTKRMDYIGAPGAKHGAFPADPEVSCKGAEICISAGIQSCILTYVNITNSLDS